MVSEYSKFIAGISLPDEVGDAHIVLELEDIPLVNRIEGHPDEGKIVGAAKLERGENGDVYVCGEVSGETAMSLSFNDLDHLSIAEVGSDTEVVE